MRTWRAIAHVLFPCAPFPTEQRLEALSRIPEGATTIGGVRVLVTRSGEPKPDLMREWAYVTATVEASDPHVALREAMPPVESLLERISFQIQATLTMQAVDVIDVTPPVALGEWRDMITSPAPFGYPTVTFSPASQAIGSSTRVLPEIGLELIPSSEKAARARDWFLKALAAPLEVDRFIFLWIATEIFAGESAVAQEQFYRANCGHEIPACPDCGATTARKVQGKTLKTYLETEFGLTSELASAAWDLRQMLHGAIGFDSLRMQSLPQISVSLHAGLLEAMKRDFGLEPNALPKIDTLNAVLVSPHLQLAGQRAITPVDLTE